MENEEESEEVLENREKVRESVGATFRWISASIFETLNCMMMWNDIIYFRSSLVKVGIRRAKYKEMWKYVRQMTVAKEVIDNLPDRPIKEDEKEEKEENKNDKNESSKDDEDEGSIIEADRVKRKLWRWFEILEQAQKVPISWERDISHRTSPFLVQTQSPYYVLATQEPVKLLTYCDLRNKAA